MNQVVQTPSACLVLDSGLVALQVEAALGLTTTDYYALHA